MFDKLRKFLIGVHLPSTALKHERLSNMQGLAIFASDSLSSTAYASEEILLVLVIAGSALLGYALPISIAITALIFITAISYRQLINEHPQGGGAYAAAKKHLGEIPSLLAASSLIFDYVLTAAVSVSAGVAAITSAFPTMLEFRVIIGVAVVIFLTIMNLRGVRESGRAFALPTYFFIGSLYLLFIVSIYKYFFGGLAPLESIPAPETGIGILAIFLIIRAFSSGCTAMTGLEATANGVQAFKEPVTKNANKVLLSMAVVLATIFIGITLLALVLHVVPLEHETVLSQIARMVFGRGPIYFLVQITTALLLLLAANTPFAGLPRLISILAQDRYFPNRFYKLGARLVYTNGIVLLTILSSLMIIVFDAKVHGLIPLYAVGVFIGFTLAQWSMVRHWKAKKKQNPENNYKWETTINTIGAITTGIVLCIVFVSKFTHGAWAVAPSLFVLIVFMRVVKAHYGSVARQLSLENNITPKIFPQKTAVVLVSGVHVGTIKGVQAAKVLKPAHIRAVHISFEKESADKINESWNRHVKDVPLDIIHSATRKIVDPLVKYVDEIDKKWKSEGVIVIIPEFVTKKIWEHFLHNQTAIQIRWALSRLKNVEILDVPYRLYHHHKLGIKKITLETIKDIFRPVSKFIKNPAKCQKNGGAEEKK